MNFSVCLRIIFNDLIISVLFVYLLKLRELLGISPLPVVFVATIIPTLTHPLQLLMIITYRNFRFFVVKLVNFIICEVFPLSLQSISMQRSVKYLFSAFFKKIFFFFFRLLPPRIS